MTDDPQAQIDQQKQSASSDSPKNQMKNDISLSGNDVSPNGSANPSKTHKSYRGDGGGNEVMFRVGGVPEHFNAPWHIANKRGLLRKADLKVQWTDFPGGTGAMTQALESGELDVAVLLTEGAVSYISKGGAAKIVGLFVRTPLTWGVHCRAGREAEFSDKANIEQATFGISRLGSGSHLMAFVYALQNGWDPKALKFKQVGSLEGAKAAMKAKSEERIDIFMWERFTTKYLCDRKEWAKVDECTTPWPCFVVCATQKCIDEKGYDLRQLLAILRLVCHDIESHRDEWRRHFCDEYKMTHEDATEWLQGVSWSCEPTISFEMLDECAHTLQKLDLLPTSVPTPKELFAHLPQGQQEDHLHNMYWYRRRQVIQVVESILARKAVTEGLTIDEEERVTHYHYWGNKAIDEAYKAMGLTDPAKHYDIMDAGSGLGGTARYWVRIKHRNTRVLAVEIQPELTALSQRLTARSQLTDKIEHLCDDIGSISVDRLGCKVDGILSLNVLLHLPDKPSVFRNLRSLLKTQGVLYAHDYYLKKEQPNDDEMKVLTDYVACKDLLSADAYKKALRESGFEIQKWDDTTTACINYTQQRSEAFRDKRRKTYEQHHGPQVADAFGIFYNAVASLFTTGVIGAANYLAVAIDK